MGTNSNIEWTTHTFNPWRGCTKVSAGCANCYADTLSKRNPGTLGVWGPNGSRVVASESYWRQPVAWDRAAVTAGERRRVFCASLADVFEHWQGPMKHSDGSFAVKQMPGFEGPMVMQDVRVRLLRLILDTPNLDWQLLTKRPENATAMLRDAWMQVDSARDPDPRNARPFVLPANLWIGTSVENQEAADERIPHLLRCPAAVRFLSAEPLLGAIDLRMTETVPKRHPGGEVTQNYVRYEYRTCEYCGGEGCCGCDQLGEQQVGPAIHWVIVGGESGPGARPMHPGWAKSLRDQCVAAGVPFFFKQHGEWLHLSQSLGVQWAAVDRIRRLRFADDPARHFFGSDPDDVTFRIGKGTAGRLLDGRKWDEFPQTA